MDPSMTPSPELITGGQITKIQDLLASQLRKSKAIFREPLQDVLEILGDQMVKEMIAVVHDHLAVRNGMVVVKIFVNPNYSLQEALSRTWCRQNIVTEIVQTMPRDLGGSTKIFFFRPSRKGRLLYDENLREEYENRGLKPVDPYSLAAVNEADPAFAATKPNLTHWKNDRGQWCHATFKEISGDRFLTIDYSSTHWNPEWWFGGVKK